MLSRTPARFLVALTLVLVLSLLAMPVLADHAWGNYHWARTSNPFTLRLGDNVSGPWDAALGESVTDWSKSSVLDLTVVPGGTTPKRCRPTTGRVEVCNAAYGRNGWLGIAQVWLSGQHITQGVAKMNDTYFSLSPYNSSVWRNHVMCQEIGHTFGLDHQDESGASLGTCMDYATDPSNSQHPNQHDYQQLELIYEHLDSTSTVAAAPAGFLHAELHSRAEWGRLLRASTDGSAAVYARDFGNGYQVVTFVIWAR